MAVNEKGIVKKENLDDPMDGSMIDHARMAKHTANSLDPKAYPNEVRILSEAAEEIRRLIESSGLANVF